MIRTPAWTLFLALIAALPAMAHPHVFVDAGHVVVFDDQGRLVAVRSIWSYDELFTLLMVEDGKYDSDGDGSISPSELKAMQMWDANWPPDYGGDLEVEVGGHLVSLEPPTDWAADWREGRAFSMHTRMLGEPAEASGGIILRPFDPNFYVAYEAPMLPVIIGRDDCRAEIVLPDDDAVSAEVAAQVASLPPDRTPEDLGLESIGRLYASEIHVKCGG